MRALALPHLFVAALACAVINVRNPIAGAGRLIRSLALGSPALGATTAVHAAVADNGAQQVVTTAITSPDVPRNVTATTTGTGANVTAVSVIVAGTDVNGVALTETLPAFSAGSNNTVVGVKAFKTVTSLTIPANGTGVSTSVGTGAKLGLPFPVSRDTVEAAYLNGVREATRPTVAFSSVNVSGNTVQLSSALAGQAVIVDLYGS